MVKNKNVIIGSAFLALGSLGNSIYGSARDISPEEQQILDRMLQERKQQWQMQQEQIAQERNKQQWREKMEKLDRQIEEKIAQEPDEQRRREMIERMRKWRQKGRSLADRSNEAGE
jgi:uncharacterized damage-inducible protein DinB